MLANVEVNNINLEKMDFISLFEEVNNRIKSLFEEYINRNLEKCNIIIDEAKIETSDYLKEKIKTESKDFILGKLWGYMSAMEQVTSIEMEKIEIKDKAPHMNEIISAINDNKFINHTELAEIVGLKKNNLTSIMKKLVEMKFVTFCVKGKSKIYYLTEDGIKYYMDNIKTNEKKINKDNEYLFNEFISFINKKMKEEN